MMHKSYLKFSSILMAFLTILVAFLISGCVTEEKITPAFQVERLEDQVNRGAPLTFTIPIQRVPIKDEFDGIGNAGHFGPAFRRLAEMIADISIERGQIVGIRDLDPVTLDLKELDEVDFDFVKEVVLQNVHIVMNEQDPKLEQQGGEAPSFSFIKSLEVYMKIDDTTGVSAPLVAPLGSAAEGSEGKESVVDSATLPERYQGAVLALSYYKGLIDLGCDGKCFDMTVHQGNWKQMLRNNRQVTLYVRVILDHAPKFSFSFGGRLSLRVLVNLNGI